MSQDQLCSAVERSGIVVDPATRGGMVLDGIKELRQTLAITPGVRRVCKSGEGRKTCADRSKLQRVSPMNGASQAEKERFSPLFLC